MSRCNPCLLIRAMVTRIFFLKAILGCAPPSGSPSFFYARQGRANFPHPHYPSAAGFQREHFLNGVPLGDQQSQFQAQSHFQEQQQQQLGVFEGREAGTAATTALDWNGNGNLLVDQGNGDESAPIQPPLAFPSEEAAAQKGQHEVPELEQSTTAAAGNDFLLLQPAAGKAKDEEKMKLKVLRILPTTITTTAATVGKEAAEVGSKNAGIPDGQLAPTAKEPGATNRKEEDDPLQPADSFGAAAEEPKAVFLPLESECPQNGVHNYTELLNCLEVEVRPFDGLASVAHELPTPTAQQNCHFEDHQAEEKCSFYSTIDASLQFTLGRLDSGWPTDQPSRQQSFDSFAQLTRRPPADFPEEHFLVAIQPEGGRPADSAVLRMDVGCQLGDGTLTFRYWCTSHQFSLKVCTRMADRLDCTPSILHTAPNSTVQIHVVNPANTPESRFTVEIIAANFSEPAILLLDDLLYQAEPCPTSEPDLPLSAFTRNDSEGGKLAEAKIFTPSLNMLPLGSAGEEQLEAFGPIKLSLPPNKMIQVRPSEITAEEGSEETVEEWRRKAEPNRQKLAKELTIYDKKRPKSWAMRLSRLLPCFDKINFEDKMDDKFRKEMLKLAQQPTKEQHSLKEHQKLTINKSVDSSKWNLDGDNTKTLLAPLNSSEMEMQKALIGKVASREKIILDQYRKLRLTNNIRRRAPLTACELLECSFGNGFCHYRQIENGGKYRLGRWHIARPQPPNINIRSRKGGEAIQQQKGQTTLENAIGHFGYAFIGDPNQNPTSAVNALSRRIKKLHQSAAMEQKTTSATSNSREGPTLYILESAEFTLNSSAELHFEVMQRGADLKICLNSMMNCAYQSLAHETGPNAAPSSWHRNEHLPLPMNTTKLFIVATKWKRPSNGWLAIDNIHLQTAEEGDKRCSNSNGVHQWN